MRDESRRARPKIFHRYLLSVLAGGLGLFLTWLVQALTIVVGFQIQLATVAVVALRMGLGTGLVALAVCAIGSVLLLLPTYGFFAWPPHPDFYRWLLFICLGIFLSWLGSTLRVSLLNEKKARQGREEAESYFHRFYDSNVLGIGFAAPDGTVFKINDYFLNLLGYTREEFEHRPFRWEDFTPTPYHYMTHEAIARLASTGKSTSFEKPYIRKDGSLIWVRLNITYLDERKKTLLAVAEDISARKKAEDSLRESEERFRHAMLDTPFPVMIHAEDGAILFLNKELQKLTGYLPDELRTIDNWVRLAYDDRSVSAKSYISRLYNLDHSVNDGEWTIHTRGGDKRVWEISSTPIGKLPDGRRIVLSMARDITDRKKIENDREEAIKARDEVIAIVSHDLRNPLTTIELNVSLLISKFQILPPSGVNRLQTIRHTVKRMNQLISDLLDMSLIESGHLRIERSDQDVRSLVEEAIENIQPIAESKHISVEKKLNCVPLKARCDRERIEQVFSNILGNAVKFVPEQKGRIIIRADCDGSSVQFSISDNGPGIAPEHLPHIFDRFWQARKNKGAGAGLGLAIAQGILKAHNGALGVNSKLNQGTTFYFSLPLSKKAA